MYPLATHISVCVRCVCVVCVYKCMLYVVLCVCCLMYWMRMCAQLTRLRDGTVLSDVIMYGGVFARTDRAASLSQGNAWLASVAGNGLAWFGGGWCGRNTEHTDRHHART